MGKGTAAGRALTIGRVDIKLKEECVKPYWYHPRPGHWTVEQQLYTYNSQFDFTTHTW